MASPSEIFAQIQSVYDRASSRARGRLGFLMSLAQQTYDQNRAGQIDDPQAAAELADHLGNMRRRAGIGSPESGVLEEALAALRKKINEHPATVAFLEAKAEGKAPPADTAPLYEQLEDTWEIAAEASSDFKAGKLSFDEAKDLISESSKWVDEMTMFGPVVAPGSLKNTMNFYDLSKQQAEKLLSLPKAERDAMIRSVEEFRSENGNLAMSSPLVHGFWRDLLEGKRPSTKKRSAKRYPLRDPEDYVRVDAGTLWLVGDEAYLDTHSLEDWYQGQPDIIIRKVRVDERYDFDGSPRLKLTILEGPEEGRQVSGFGPSSLFRRWHDKQDKLEPKKASPKKASSKRPSPKKASAPSRESALKAYGEWKIEWRKGNKGSTLVVAVHPEHGQTILFVVEKASGRFFVEDEPDFVQSYPTLAALKAEAGDLIRRKLVAGWGEEALTQPSAKRPSPKKASPKKASAQVPPLPSGATPTVRRIYEHALAGGTFTRFEGGTQWAQGGTMHDETVRTSTLDKCDFLSADHSKAPLRMATMDEYEEHLKWKAENAKRPSKASPKKASSKRPSPKKASPKRPTPRKRPSARPLAWPGMIESPTAKVVAIAYDQEKAYPYSQQLEGPFELLLGGMPGRPEPFENTVSTGPLASQIGDELASRLAKHSIPFEVVDLTSVYVFLATDAPERYDGFGTTWIGTGRGLGGDPSAETRIVAVRKEHIDWQQNRYRSGNHAYEVWEPQKRAPKRATPKPAAPKKRRSAPKPAPKRASPPDEGGPIGPYHGLRGETIEEWDNNYVLWRVPGAAGSTTVWWVITDYTGKMVEGTVGKKRKSDILAQWRELTGASAPKKVSSKRRSAPPKPVSAPVARGPIQAGVAPRVDKIHLQGVGSHDAIPAAYLQPGDTAVWNYGHTSKVLDVEPLGTAFVRAKLRSEKAGAGERTSYRKLKASRMVGVTRPAVARVREQAEWAAKRLSARKRQSTESLITSRPLARHLIDQFNNALAPLFEGYFFRVYEDRGPGGVGVAVEAAQAPAGATKQQAIKSPVIVGLHMTGYPEAGRQWVVGDPAPPEVQVYARSARTGEALPPLARLFGHHHGLPQQMAGKIVNFFRKHADAIKSAPPHVQMGQDMKYMEGFRLREPSVQRCLGRREIRRMLADLYDDNLIENLVDRLAPLAHRNADMPWSLFKDMAEEAVDQTGSNIPASKVIDVFQAGELLRFPEAGDVVRFMCSDMPYDAPPPTGGDLTENTEWALEVSGMDPNLAPSLLDTLRKLQDDNAGLIIDESDYSDAIVANWMATLAQAGRFVAEYDTLHENLKRGLVILEVPYTPMASYAVDGFYFPPASVARTPMGAREFFADEAQAWKDGKRAYALNLDLKKGVDKDEYEDKKDDYLHGFETAEKHYKDMGRDEPWRSAEKPAKRASGKRSSKRVSPKKVSSKLAKERRMLEARMTKIAEGYPVFSWKRDGDAYAIRVDDATYKLDHNADLDAWLVHWMKAGREEVSGTTLADVIELFEKEAQARTSVAAAAAQRAQRPVAAQFTPRPGMVLEGGWIIKNVSPNAKRVSIYLPEGFSRGAKVSRTLTFNWNDERGTWIRQGSVLPLPASFAEKQRAPKKPSSKRRSARRPIEYQPQYPYGTGDFRADEQTFEKVVTDLANLAWKTLMEQPGRVHIYYGKPAQDEWALFTLVREGDSKPAGADILTPEPVPARTKDQIRAWLYPLMRSIQLLPVPLEYPKRPSGKKRSAPPKAPSKKPSVRKRPSQRDFTDDELVAMCIMTGYKSFARPEQFEAAKLGDYAPSNPIIASLTSRGLVKVSRNGTMTPDHKLMRAIMKRHPRPSERGRYPACNAWNFLPEEQKKKPSPKKASPRERARQNLFRAQSVGELFILLQAYLGRVPTATEMREYTNTVLGPADIPESILAQCQPSAKKPSAKKPSAKKPSAKKPSPKTVWQAELYITETGAFNKLARIEGEAWAKKQKAGGVKLDNGFFLNLEAFKVIEEQGLAGLDIPLSDLDDKAGVIAGTGGTGYIVMPDGEIMLDGASATEAKRKKAAKVMQVIVED